MTQFYVKVVPDSEKFSVEKGTYPEIFLTEKAENGRANSELKHKMEEILGTGVGIVSGHNSRRKKLAADIEQEKIDERLEDQYE